MDLKKFVLEGNPVCRKEAVIVGDHFRITMLTTALIRFGIYPWVIRYQYKIGKDTYYGQSHWFWFNPLVSKGTPIKVTIDPQNPERSIVAAWES